MNSFRYISPLILYWFNGIDNGINTAHVFTDARNSKTETIIYWLVWNLLQMLKASL